MRETHFSSASLFPAFPFRQVLAFLVLNLTFAFGEGGPIAAGDSHSIRAVDLNAASNGGTLWTWGNNRNGQLGTGDEVSSSEALKIGAATTWVEVSAGNDHSVALRSDGTLWGMGSNAQGQLGLGPEVSAVNLPTQIGTDSDWVAVAAGAFHTLALKTNGTLWAFGSDNSGQLGNGDVGSDGNPFENSFLPLMVSSGSFTSIAAGDFHSAAVDSSGALFTWGDNLQGSLGQGNADPFFAAPTQVGGAGNWRFVAAGGGHTLAIRTDGTLWAAGRNLEGQLGIGPLLTNQPEFVQVGTESDWLTAATGSRHSLGIKTDNTLWAWGLNADGQLGDGAFINLREPTRIGAAADWVAVAAGRKHSLAANSRDEVFAAGDNGRGQLGNPLFPSSNQFSLIVFDDSEPGQPRPDFVIENLAVDNVSFKFSLGQTIDFSFELVNNGADFIPSEAVEISVRLNNATSGDIPLESVFFNSGLASGGRTTLTGSIFIDPAPGVVPLESFSLILAADANNSVIEEDETNNETTFANAFEILRSPDFSIESVSPLISLLKPGETVQFNIVVGNLTDGAGDHPVDSPAVPIDIIMTTNGIIGDGDDIDVGTVFLDSGISFNETVPLLETLNLPTLIPTNDYFFAFNINPENTVLELNSDNNILITQESFSFLPDFEFSSGFVFNNDLMPGDPLSYSVTIRNSGAEFEDDVAEMELQVILTTDGVIGNGDDIAIGSVVFTDGFSFGESKTFSDFNNPFTLPAGLPSDIFFVGFKVQINTGPEEFTLDNNERVVDRDFSVFPDLVVTRFVFTDNSFVRGSEIGFKVGVRNQGGDYIAASNPPLTVDIILTRDSILGNEDDIVLLEGAQGLIQHAGDLLSDAEFLDTKAYKVPALDPDGAFPAGTYFPVVRVDAANSAGELTSTLGNNRLFLDSLDLFGDLEVTAADVPVATYNRGDDIAITSITVENTAEFDLADTTSIQVRLSKNRVFGDLDDIILIDSLAVNNALVAHEAEVIATFEAGSTAVPDDTPAGDYFLAIRVDPGDLAVESNDTNNTFFTDTALLKVDEDDLAKSLEEHLPDAAGSPPTFEEKQGLSLTLGGDASWFAQTAMTTGTVPGPIESTAAGQSGDVGDGEESFFEFSIFIAQPFEISFLWKVDSEPGFDTLSFSINDEERNTISGLGGDFETVVTALDPGTFTFRWTYRKDDSVSQGADAGWVDSVTFKATATPPLPDLVVDELFFQPGTFVLQQDSLALTLLGRNQGSAADIQSLPDEFSVKVYLSANSSFEENDDPLIGELLMLRDLDSNGSFIFESVVGLPIDLAPGDYHLVADVDATDIIAEFDETNNVFISENPDITIEARPDLKVISLNHDPGFFLFGDTLTLDFEILNEGLIRVSDPFSVKVVLSGDRTFGDAGDFVLTEVEFSGGLSVNQTQPFSTTIQIGSDTPIGTFLFIGAVVDSGSEIPESSEDNNSFGSEERDLFFSATSLETALDLNEAEGTEGGATAFQIINNVNAPFFGEVDDTFDTIDAVQSSRIVDGATASFSVTVVPQTRTVVSFRWRVSSEKTDASDGGIKEDVLSFSIDGQKVASISGELDWSEASFVLEAGEHTLRWAYTKDETTSEGKDAGFVDRLKLIVPDLVATGLDFQTSAFTLPSPPVADFFTITIENQGIADVPPTPPYTVSIVMSLDEVIDSGDFLLDSFTRNDGLPAGGSLELKRDLNIPENIAFPGNYHIIVTLDSEDVVPEADETNNQAISDPADFTIDLAGLTLEEALDDATLTLDTGGDGVWFPQLDRTLADGTTTSNDGTDAAQSPALGFNESSFLEIEVEGPKELTFFWKVSSEPTLDVLSLELNGTERKRISGDLDWQQESLFIPSGLQKVRWVWSKLSNALTGEDAGWVDQIVLTTVTVPELVITNLDVTPGEYVLDVTEVVGSPGQLLGTEFLDITVEAENQGADFPGAGAGFFTRSDIEVRLSGDNIFGNDDDILLGEFARVEETFDGGLKVKFLGPIHLGDDIPEGNYFVLAKIDPLEDVSEFDDTNNIAATSGPDVQITRLPDLELLSFTYDERKIYFTKESLKMDFTIHNLGLDAVDGNTEWKVKVALRAIAKDTVQGFADTFNDPQTAGQLPSVDDFDGASTTAIELGSFTQSQLMLGRRDGTPDGDTIDVSNFLFLPHFDRLETSIGQDESVENFLYWFEITVDDGDAVRESDELNRNLLAGVFNLVSNFPDLSPNDSLFEIRFNPGSIDSDQWGELYGVNAGVTVDEGDGVDNVLEYALNRDPLVADASNDQLTSFGVTKDNEDEFISLTFDMVFQATDLEYTVRVAGADMVFTDHLVLTPPFTNLVGALSLNGDGGLTSNPIVLQAIDNGYTARVTVRDNVPLDGATARFMKLVITDADGSKPLFTSTPVTTATENLPYAYNITADDDGGGAALKFTFVLMPDWLDPINDNGDGTAIISGTPGALDIGDNPVLLQVEDGDGKLGFQSFTITVGAGSDPMFTSTEVTTATENATYTYNITANDDGGAAALTFTFPLLPAWIDTMTDNGDGTAIITGTPGALDIGDHSVLLQVEDGAGQTDTQSFTITVEAAP